MPLKWAVSRLKMGQKCVKNTFFQKMILDHLGCSNKFFLPIFSPR